MHMPDETQPDQSVPAAVAATAPPPPLPAEPVEAQAVVEAAAPAAKAPRPPPKPLVSDETLAEYQAAIAAEQAARRRQQLAATAARERAEGFRALRAALRRLDEQPEREEPEADPLRDDELAVAVHEAPKRIRTIIAATLKALSKAPRRGRR